ncbi:MAG: helix-turn-helix domain-containing protein [Actinomycetota bacterium]|nr:helix-turn-helix domain-containing protein [Actinomycetota bacterium]
MTTAPRSLNRVAVVVAEPVPVFELGVLCEVFGLDRSRDGLPSFEFAICSELPGKYLTSSGFEIVVEHSLGVMESADLIAVPGWSTDGAPISPRMQLALTTALARGAQFLSVCSGAFLLASAGLLDGRTATTHWRYAAILEQLYPNVDVKANSLYEVDGPITTGAGTAAGIDAALDLVRREFGPEIANAIARRMVIAPHRSGGQAQFAQSPIAHRGEKNPSIGLVIEWMLEHIDESMTTRKIAGRAGMSERTFARRFREATGTTPYAWLTEQRILLAEELLEQGVGSISQIARDTGLGSPQTLRHHFARLRGTNPTNFRYSFHR